MAGTSTPLKTPNSRVFLIEGRARGDHKPSYESGLRMMGVSQGFGDIERVEVPDPHEYGKYIEVTQIRGAEERPTTSLEGRYAMSLKSTLLELARRKCAADVQLHIGKCTDPSLFNTFEKIVVLEQAYLTNFGTDDLGNLASSDEAVVNENADISAKELYEILPMSFGIKAGSVVANEVLDVTLCDSASCGDCEDESTGCEKIYAVTKYAGGSPATIPDIVFTIDGGTVWYSHDIDSLSSEDPTGIDCLGSYVVVISNASNSLHYVLKSTIDGLLDPTWTEITTGFVTGGEPNAIFSIGGKAFIVGDLGYIYVTEDPTAGVTVLDAGSATGFNLKDVEALSETFIVAVGDNGAIVVSEDGVNFSAATSSPVGVAITLNFVCLKSESEWWVGTSAGRLYYTLNGGSTWTEKAFPGSGAGVCYDMQFATDSVAFLSHATVTPAGRILRSYDGGYSWQVVPERAGATLPANDRVNKLAVCTEDANFVVGVGLADDASDGYIVMGAAS